MTKPSLINSIGEWWQKMWLRTAVYGVILIALSIGLAHLVGSLFAQFDISQEATAPIVYAVVFGSTLVMNTTILVPIPLATAIMMAAASQWNPVLIAFVASIGGALGELSGYYAGRLGKRIIVDESSAWYQRISAWMDRYGAWTIFFLAFIPFMPFDIGGIIAGGAKMPLWKFLLPCWAGKFPKYVILCYAALGVFQFLPVWFP
jgi:uncharacterized membrane protein YdjX (TVP38/TMEM64 family)